ncbi:MAG: MBL fold metallo-hydrolase [Promethearchaeota archaeon]|jgi:glyoxylase-like metal-dependent hydrolase (beta-lactamase superfamily II)
MFFRKDDSEKIGKEVISGVYYFSENQMLDCNQYIIRDKTTSELTLIDAGNAISLEGLFRGMERLNLNYQKINKVFLTHEHVDHVLGIYKLLNTLSDNPPEIYAYGETTKILEKGDETKILPIMFGLTARRFGIEIEPLRINDLSDLKEIRITPEHTFEIYFTPGHSVGSVCYYEPKKKVLLPGDLIFTGGSFGRFDLPGGSLETLISSIKFINDLDIEYLLPGHMGISKNGNQSVALTYKMIESMGSYY